MAGPFRFRSRIDHARDDARGGGALAAIPDDVTQALGGRRQMRVFGTVSGVPIKSSTMAYRGQFWVGVHKETRAAAGVDFGDEVEIELTRDDSPRVLELPPELDAAFKADPSLRTRFDALAFTRRKEVAESIRTAVKPETRAARLQKAIDSLKG